MYSYTGSHQVLKSHLNLFSVKTTSFKTTLNKKCIKHTHYRYEFFQEKAIIFSYNDTAINVLLLHLISYK